MSYTELYPTCPKDCIYSKLLFCDKYQEECVSFIENNERFYFPCLSCLNDEYYNTPNKIKENNSTQPVKQAYFHIPEPSLIYYIEKIFKIRQLYPFAFYENRQITEIYGTFAGTLWNGRNPMFNQTFLSIQEISRIKNRIEKLGLSLNLTWNNHQIKGNDIYDKYCNTITELFHNGQHAITVASDELFQYLKDKYPNFNYYRSIIKTEKENIIPTDSNYDMLLVPQKLNNNWEILDSIPENQRYNLEFLCNDNCFPFCDRSYHYNVVNYCLSKFCEESCIYDVNCPVDQNFTFYNTKRWPTTITPELIDTYIEKNFNHFKLCSRGDKISITLYKICKYLIKPEYFDDIYFQIMEGIDG